MARSVELQDATNWLDLLRTHTDVHGFLLNKESLTVPGGSVFGIVSKRIGLAENFNLAGHKGLKLRAKVKRKFTSDDAKTLLAALKKYNVAQYRTNRKRKPIPVAADSAQQSLPLEPQNQTILSNDDSFAALTSIVILLQEQNKKLDKLISLWE